MRPDRARHDSRRTDRTLVLAVAAVVLLSLSLRVPTAGLGPLMPYIRSDTGHQETFLSLLTAIPLVLTAMIAPLTPRLATRLGRDRLIGAVLVVIVAATLLRSVPGDIGLLAGTALLGSAIAAGTVLAPAAIAAQTARRRGVLTAMYTMALSLGPALALALTVPTMQAFSLGWRATLVVWSLCSVLALGVWVAYSRGSDERRHRPPQQSLRSEVTVVRDPRVWVLALYLGITSLTFYTTSTWFPTVLTMEGLSTGAAGGYTSLISVIAVPFAFLAPLGMRHAPRVVAPCGPVLAVAGIVGFLGTSGEAGVLVAAVLLGVSQGLCLGVSYDQIIQFSVSPAHAAAVAALASAVGVSIAALGPVLFGFGLETSGATIIPLSGLAGIVAVQSVIGVGTGAMLRRRWNSAA